MPFVHLSDFFQKYNTEMVQAEAKWETIAATATFRYQYCHFLALLCTDALGWFI